MNVLLLRLKTSVIYICQLIYFPKTFFSFAFTLHTVTWNWFLRAHQPRYINIEWKRVVLVAYWLMFFSRRLPNEKRQLTVSNEIIYMNQRNNNNNNNNNDDRNHLQSKSSWIQRLQLMNYKSKRILAKSSKEREKFVSTRRRTSGIKSAWEIETSLFG